MSDQEQASVNERRLQDRDLGTVTLSHDNRESDTSGAREEQFSDRRVLDVSKEIDSQNVSDSRDPADSSREVKKLSSDHGDSSPSKEEADDQSSELTDFSDISRKTNDQSLVSRDLPLVDSNREMENLSPDDQDLSEKSGEEMEEQSSDEAGFAILDRDPEDMEEADEEMGMDSEGDEHSDEENEFSIVNKESADDTDKDLSDLGHDIDSGDHENVNVQRPVDLFVNGGNVRQRQAFYRRKAKRIEKILSEDPVDVSELRQQAISQGGLLNAEFRQKAWPLLLKVNINNIAPKPDEEVLRGHRDYNQVVMDVNRSIKRFPPGMEENHRLSLQDKLVDVIMRVLVRHPELHYYQGFHDICVTFLLVVDEDLAFALVEKLSQSHLRDFMEPTMERTQQLLDYVPCLIRRANPELLQYLEGAELGNVFCVSWLLTWFGHVLNDIASILRIYDFFIACHPLMPVYVLGAVVLHREKEIFATEQDMASLYQLLTRVPDNLPFEHLLSNAGDLYLQYPPTELANEAIRRFRRAQEKAAEHRAMILERQHQNKRRASLLPDGNVTFTKVTCWMLGAVVGVAAYALYTGMEWGLSSWTPH